MLIILALTFFVIFYIFSDKMSSKHVVKLSSIFEFFEKDNKIIKRGENAVESGHVKKCSLRPI